jgi:glyoxylase-like metal-dependent hydrolase (beta-lactamase superfamily II)
MPFLTEPEPPRHVAEDVAPGIRRLVADNPSPMTYHGTNTYLVEDDGGFAVIDPGPDERRHLDDILALTGGRITAIVVTHRHSDHRKAAKPLARETGAPILSFATAAGHPPVAGLIPLHTPGHASDHLCFARADGVLFTGDHVMSWNGSAVFPPDGNMAAYFDSLALLLERDDRLYLPGHGPPLSNPQDLVRDMQKHRQQREAAIAAAIRQAPRRPREIVDLLYKVDYSELLIAAEMNVVAHLQKLRDEGLAVAHGESWSAPA